ncbi:MAG TPA: sugar ABC transporter permease [Candidatus Limiplasma sp.]|nr:sugar ABC transporter permease [Candidatus Limiplasma sp.]HPR77436.1 sugar ABC transporter permease [Candidatus Limiplasma sp.]
MQKTVRKRKLTGINDPKVVPYVMIAPFLLYFLLIYLYPTVSSILMSFQKIDGPNTATFIGLSNYKKLLSNNYLMALQTTGNYTLWDLLILIPVPLIFAAILSSRFALWPNFFKSLYFIPALTSIIVAGIVFRLAFGSLETALANRVCIALGLPSTEWLNHFGTGNFVLVLMTLWRWMGVNIIYFYSAIRAIPQDLYEAARIDGAGELRSFFSITLPSIRPVLIYVITITVLGGFSMFTESVALWQQSNPGGIGRTIVGYMYMMGIYKNNMGLASAVGITLLLLVSCVNLVQLTLMGFFRKEEKACGDR